MRIVTILNKKPFKGHKKRFILSCFIYNPWKKTCSSRKFREICVGPRNPPLLTSLSKQACNNIDITSLVQLKFSKLVPSCQQVVTSLLATTLVQHCHNKLATSLSTTCYKPVTTTWDKQCEQILQQACWNKLATSLLQVCYNLCVFTCVVEVFRKETFGYSVQSME